MVHGMEIAMALVHLLFCRFLGNSATFRWHQQSANRLYLARPFAIRKYSEVIRYIYLGTSSPGFPAFKADPVIDVRNSQEFGNAGMGYHLRLRFSQNPHGHSVVKETSDSSFLKACLLSNLFKGNLTSRRYHIRNMVTADCFNADQIVELVGLGAGKFWHSLGKTYRGKFEYQLQGIQEELM